MLVFLSFMIFKDSMEYFVNVILNSQISAMKLLICNPHTLICAIHGVIPSMR